MYSRVLQSKNNFEIPILTNGWDYPSFRVRTPSQAGTRVKLRLARRAAGPKAPWHCDSQRGPGTLPQAAWHSGR